MSSFVKLTFINVSMWMKILSTLNHSILYQQLALKICDTMMLQQYLFDVILHFRCDVASSPEKEKGHVALVFWVRAAVGVTLLSPATLDTWQGTMSYILSTKKKDKLDSSKNLLEIFSEYVWEIYFVGSWRHFALT